ncbi:MAG: terminase small subunit [Parvibaculum sp.]|nr:terminase small subunit [Parvibaculum sp.]
MADTPAKPARKRRKKDTRRAPDPDRAPVKGRRPTPMKERFVSAYLANGGHGTKAAEEAGSAHPAEEACRWLKDAWVKAEIAKRTKKAAEKQAISEERVIANLAALVETTILDILDIDEATGEVSVDLRKLSREHAMAIKEVKVERTGEGKDARQSIELKLADKHAPLRTLAQCFGLMEGDSPVIKMMLQQNNVFVGSLGKLKDEEVIGILKQYSEGRGPSRLVPVN